MYDSGCFFYLHTDPGAFGGGTIALHANGRIDVRGVVTADGASGGLHTGGGSGGSSPIQVAPTPTPSSTPTPTPTTAGCSLSERKAWALGQLQEWYLFPELLDTSVNPDSF